MDKDMLKKAFDETLTPQYAAMLDIDDTLLLHKFSKYYIKNRNKLIKRRSHSYYKLISTAGRRAACFIAVLFIALFTAVFSVEALHTAFMDFIMQIFSTHTIFQSEKTENSPETIEDIYAITYNMGEFEIGAEIYNEKSRYIAYIIDNEKMVAFTQSVKSEWNSYLNTEEATPEEIKTGGIDIIYFIDKQGYHNYLWDNGIYIFNIYGNIKKTTMEMIVLSVKNE